MAHALARTDGRTGNLVLGSCTLSSSGRSIVREMSTAPLAHRAEPAPERR